MDHGDSTGIHTCPSIPPSGIRDSLLGTSRELGRRTVFRTLTGARPYFCGFLLAAWNFFSPSTVPQVLLFSAVGLAPSAVPAVSAAVRNL